MNLKRLNWNYTSKRKLNTQSLITNQTLSKDLNWVRDPREYIKKLKIPQKPQLSVRTRTAAHKTQNTKLNHNLKGRKMSQQPKKPLKPAKTPKIPKIPPKTPHSPLKTPKPPPIHPMHPYIPSYLSLLQSRPRLSTVRSARTFRKNSVDSYSKIPPESLKTPSLYRNMFL